MRALATALDRPTRYSYRTTRVADTGHPDEDHHRTAGLPVDLLERSKAVARQEHSTLDALIEEGLRLALRARTRKRAAPFAVQPFQGDGLTPEFTAAGWERIRDEIYRDGG